MQAPIVPISNKQWPALQIPALIISYLFHPLLLPTFFYYWLLVRYPTWFPGYDDSQPLAIKLLQVVVNTAILPGISVLLLKPLGFIRSLHMRDRKERIIPYVLVMFFYWWMFYLTRNFKGQPEVLKAFYLGIFICISLGLILNSFIKISMHSMGVGGLAMAVCLTVFYYGRYFPLDVMGAILLAGIVCTSRLLVNSHTPKEIYLGLLVGVLSQLIGALVML
jgi:hypothetical protein